MTTQAKPALYALTPQQHATVIAALCYYNRMLDYKHRTFDGLKIATIVGEPVDPLDEDGVNKLCKSLDHTGLDFGQIVPLFAESAKDSPYVRAAQESAREGEFEVDDPAVVSKGDDNGAYIMGWMWVSDDDAGLNTYGTLQLASGIPDGAKVIGGGKIPPEPVWYFGDEVDYARAKGYADDFGLKYETSQLDRLPDDVEGVDDFETFKEHVDERLAQRERV